MNYHMLVVFDRAAKSYLRPFVVNSVGIAERDFRTNINQASENNPMYQHPDDFDLYLIGSYDDESAALKGCTPQILLTGKEVAKR